MKTKLPILLFIASVASGLTAAVPKDAMGVLTIQPGQLLEKFGYKELKLWELIPAEEKKEIPDFIMEVIKDPSKTGLDLSKPFHFFGNLETSLALPKKGDHDPVVLGGGTMGVKNAGQLTRFIDALAEIAEEEDGQELVKENVDGATVYTIKDEPSIVLVQKGTDLVVLGSNYNEVYQGIKGKKRRKKLPKPAEWIREKAMGIAGGQQDEDPNFKKHLAKKNDIAFFFDYQKMTVIFDQMKDVLGADEETESLMKILDNPALKPYLQAKISAGINFTKGAIEASAQYHLKENPYKDMLGDGVSKRLLDILPAKPIMYAGSSVKMGGAKKLVRELYLPVIKELMEDQEFNMSTPLPVVGTSINDLLSIPGGDFVFYLRDVKKAPGPIPLPQIELIIGFTVNNRAKFDQLIDKLTNPKDADPDAPKFNLEQTLGFIGMSLIRTDDAIFLCHKNFAEEVKAGKSNNPLEQEHRKKLTSGYANYFLDFPRLTKAAESWIPAEQMKEEGVQTALDFLRSLDQLEAHQNKDLSSSMTLTLKDKERNSLRIIGDFLKKAAALGLAGKKEPVPKSEPDEAKPEPEPSKPKRPKQALVPDSPPPPEGSIPYQISTSKDIDLDSEDFQKFLATFRGKISDEENLLVGRWKGINDTAQENRWEILQRGDRSFSMVIRGKDQEWEEVPLLHGAWRVDGGKLLYVVLQVENRHLPFGELKIYDEDVKTLEKANFSTIGEEQDGKEFNSSQTRVKRFESPRMWRLNNPESLKDFTFHIPPEPLQ